MWKRKWVRWLVRVGLPVLIAAVAIPTVERMVRRHDGESAVRAIRARLDAEDPGWRLDDLLAERNAATPPDGENVTTAALAIYPSPRQELLDWAKRNERFAAPPDVNRRPTADEVADATKTRDACLDAVGRARGIRTLTRGGYRLDVAPNPLDTRLPHADALRGVSNLLKLDASVRALAGDPNGAVASAHAAVITSRGLCEPMFLVELVLRLALDLIAVEAAERVLAWSEPKQGLAELQDALTAEGRERGLTNALRFERALFDRLLDNLDNGTLDRIDEADRPRGELGRFAVWYGRARWPADRAKGLELFTALIDASRLSARERPAGFDAVELPRDRRYAVTALLFPAANKVDLAELRGLARVRSAAAAIACERFRQARGRWPTDLAEVPKGILPAIPTDPYTDEPLRFRRTEDGVVVYAVGPDRTDDGGHLSYATPQDGDDVGFRLWDPAHRSAPPAPASGGRQPPE
jgi:hypothetical protein